MDSLHDYILWLGDYPFSAVPFQEADAVILCLLAYFDFSPLFAQSDEAVLRDARQMVDSGAARVQGMGKAELYVRILSAAAASRRFGELRMNGYVDILLPETPMQFSAVTFHDDAGLSFLAYRGTDSTLAGWREDFMISFTHTQAQALARQYAESRVGPGRAWYIGGHSKGGNLALYAACTLPEDRLAAVKRVFMLDGPGFCPEVMEDGAVSRIQSLVTRMIPGFSVIGKLFEPRIDDTLILRSSASELLQHDLATWGVDHGRLATLPQTDPRSDLVNEILKKWIGNMDREDRKVFVNELFDALGAGGAETLEALVSEGLEGYENILPRFQNASDVTRRILRDLPRQAMQTLLRALFHREDA